MRAQRLPEPIARLLATLALAAPLLLVATPALASYSIDEVDIDATVSADGSLAVSETREFDFDGSYHGVYWNIPTGTYEGREVSATVTSVGEVTGGGLVPFTLSDAGADGTYQVTDRGSYVQVKLYSAHEDESVRFQINYTDANLASRWADTGELYWKFVSDGWDVESQDVTCTIHLPVPEGASVDAGQNVRAWGHGPLDASVAFSGDDVVYEVPGVGTEEYAEARVVFPAEWLSGETASSESRLDSILSQEQQWADEANARRQRARAIEATLLVACLVGGVGTIVLAVVTRRRYRSSHRAQFADRYFRDVPSADHPAVLAALLNDGKATSEGFTAALMRLTDERLVRLDGQTTSTKGAFGRTKQRSDYRITRSESVKRQQGASAAEACAADVDRATMDFLFGTILAHSSHRGAQGEDSILFSDFKDVATRDASAYSEGYETWEGEVEGACLKRGFFTDARPTHRGVMYACVALDVLLAIGAVVCVLNGIVSSWGLLAVLLLAVGAVVCSHTAKGLREVSSEAVELEAKLAALRRWLKEFTHLDEAVPRDVVLWNRLLVMAVALGVSEEVIKQLKVAAPEVLEDPYVAPVYGWWYVGPGFSRPPVNDVAEAARSAHQVSSAALAASRVSSGSGGGGGFSGGGGGGFGGGGGGGAF